MQYLKLTSILLFSFGASFAQTNQKKTDSTLFDWNSYSTWEDITIYTKTYVVNQRHPKASDQNSGTIDLPFLTINKAAQVVIGGERVLICAGIYRETIRPLNEGKNSAKMILYEAAPGEEVIIKGSRILNNKFEQRGVFTSTLSDTTHAQSEASKIWLTILQNEIFENGYYPFQLPNILPVEYELMPWANQVKNIFPYSSSRGLLLQDGKRMTLLDRYEDLTQLPGSFWVDKDGRTIHIHAFDSKNPEDCIFEAGVQSHLLKPQKIGMGYIHIKGLTFEHCANGFLRTSTGAVTALGGHHWIIENNTIRHNNSSGLEFGYYAFEATDTNPENIQPRKDKDLGGVIVRNNKIYDCGTAGIRSYSVRNGIISDNTIWNCGWQNAENYWEVAGIKILRAINTLVKGNHIYNIKGGNGIWLDWDIQHSRITANIIHNVQTIQGGIFVEASQVENLVDNNFIWDIDGNGIYGNDSDELLIVHNLIANPTGHIITAAVATKRKLNDRWLTATKNKIFNNLFINGGAPINFGSENNQAENNVYVTTRQSIGLDLKAGQERKFDKNSPLIFAKAGFDPLFLYFSWQSDVALPDVPVLKFIKTDFFNNERYEDQTIPGPFAKSSKNVKVLLLENKFLDY
jgi:alpha-L-arabinofuranosidase